MKITRFLQICVAVVVGGLLAQAGFAQAPNGTINSPRFTGPQGLYDITGLVTNISDDFISGPNDTVRISEDVNLVAAGTGVVTANGTNTTVTVVESGSDHPGSFSFPATYTVKGSIKTSGANVLLGMTLAAKGSAVNNGVTQHYSEALTFLITVNPTTGVVTGHRTGTATQSGSNSGTIKVASTSFVPEIEPLDWSLSMTVSSRVAKVSGDATVSLPANGRTFPFHVTGTYSARTGAKLTLAGYGDGKGATLTVAVSSNTITAISGTLLGQKINLKQ